MYERFYGLRERPFSLTPDPDYLYLGKVHEEALGYLRYGIETQAGFVVITGEIGSGKTTLLQALMTELDRGVTFAHLVNTMLDAGELLESILLELGLSPAGKSKPERLYELAAFLVRERRARRTVLIVIDEAQNLSPIALEELRLLSNLETEKSKLLHVLLVGQPELREVLSRPDLEQLRQRVTVSYHIRPLDESETGRYVAHRLRRASIGTPIEFPPEVIHRVHQLSGGVPRLVNVVCDAILVFGYASDRSSIDLALVDEVTEELIETGVLTRAPDADDGTDRMERSETRQRVAVQSEPPAAPPSGLPLEQPARVRELEERITARERALSEREREVAEQARILAEEYRLVHAREAASSTPAGSARNAAPWPPAGSKSHGTRTGAASSSSEEGRGDDDAGDWHGRERSPRRYRLETPRPGLWSRLKRAITGSPALAPDGSASWWEA